MPVYDYKCSKHGVFNDLAAMENHDSPCLCPQCGELSPRVVVIPPSVMEMPAERKAALELNEKSQHEPEFSTKDRRENDHQHRSGCGCENKMGKSKVFYTATGDKMFPSMRPWMISH